MTVTQNWEQALLKPNGEQLERPSAVQWLWHRTESKPFWSSMGNSWNVPIRFRFLFCFYSNSIPLSFLHFLALSLVIFFFLHFFSPYSCLLALSFSFFLLYLSLYSFLQLFLSYVLPIFLFLSFFLIFSLCYHFSFFFISAVQLGFRFFQLSITAESLFYHHVWTKIILNFWPQTKWDHCARHFKCFRPQKC